MLKLAHIIIILMTIKIEDIDLDNILLDEKQHENIFIYDISNTTFIGSKRLCIRFNKADGFIMRVYDETRYLVLFGPKNFDVIYNKNIIYSIILPQLFVLFCFVLL